MIGSPLPDGRFLEWLTSPWDLFLEGYSVALIILTPFLMLIWIVIRIDNPGPAIFVQPRQGRYGIQFKMLKFRTMFADQSCSIARGGFTTPNDPRITRVGRCLRQLHLDELPQLINVVRGEMSLVGPRPEAFAFAARMRNALPLYELRYLIRPGITGYGGMLGYLEA